MGQNLTGSCRDAPILEKNDITVFRPVVNEKPLEIDQDLPLNINKTCSQTTVDTDRSDSDLPLKINKTCSQTTVDTHRSDSSTVVSHTFGMMTDEQAFQEEREWVHMGIDQDEMYPDFNGPCAQCKQGQKGSHPNQDNFSFTYTQDGWGIACVSDGHGVHGHFVASWTVQTIPHHLVRSQFWPNDMRSALFEAFEKGENELGPAGIEQQYDVQNSGTTFVCLVWKDSKLWAANTGDSRLIVSTKTNGRLLFETKDHKVDEPKERKRLEAAGCEVKTKTYSDGLKVARVFRRGYEYPGLCMSRSLGDLAVHRFGITSQPDISEIDVNRSDRPFAILATDGVWDVLDSRQVADIAIQALKQQDFQDPLTPVIQSSYEAWKAKEDVYCDDITAIFIPLDATPILTQASNGLEW